MNYPYGQWGPGWGPPQGVQYPVFVPSPGPDGRPPRGKSLVKQFKEWKEFQDLMGGQKKEEQKKPEGPKKAMIPMMEGLFLAVLLSPFLGLPTLYLYKALFQMWGAAIGVK